MQLKLVQEDPAQDQEPSAVTFESFWSHYPKKMSKKDARKAWNDVHPSLHQKIMEAVERAKMSRQWRKADRDGTVGAFIPYAASFLRGEMWEDELEVDLPPAPSSPTSSAGKSLEILGRRKP